MAQSSFSKSSQSSAQTVIGSGLTVEGEITGDDAITVQGTVKGRIAVEGAVTVESSGVVEADIEATELRNSGTVTGNVAATERVELSENASLVGDVRSARIRIAEGATFKGHIDMDV